jgi:peptidoglycan/xylan/chitin deacetylase (PgdA/CDA1 family)
MGGAPAEGSASPDARPADPDTGAPTAAFAIAEVATWRGGAEAAYSLVHDSACDPSAEGNFNHADPELMKRGLRGAFGVIAGSCGVGPASKWARVKTLAMHGHEMINHSLSHACLGNPTGCGGGRRASSDFALEIDRAAQLLLDNTGQTVRYFDFPFDACGTEALAHLRSRDYLGARCGGRGVSPADIPDGFQTRYDVWGPSFSMYRDRGPCQGVVPPSSSAPPETLPPACRRYVLDQYVEDALAQKGWATRTFTGFSDDVNSFQPIALGDYTAHLDFVKAKVDAGRLWVAGPSEVLTYRWAREKCARPTVEGSTLVFPEPSAECRRYATTLSYVVTAVATPAPATLTATQAHSDIRARTLAPGRYLVDADPTLGDAVLAP